MRASSRTSILRAKIVEELDELISVRVHRRLVSFYVLVDVAFHSLPTVGPKPRLVRRDREPGPKFDDAVVALDDLDVRAGFVQAITTTELCRKRE
jgi:hypothetical protein